MNVHAPMFNSFELHDCMPAEGGPACWNEEDQQPAKYGRQQMPPFFGYHRWSRLFLWGALNIQVRRALPDATHHGEEIVQPLPHFLVPASCVEYDRPKNHSEHLGSIAELRTCSMQGRYH